MKKEFHKQAIILFLTLVLLIVIFFAAVFIFKYKFSSSSILTKSSNAVSLEFIEDNAISITNMLPVTDEVGKRIQSTADKDGVQGYFDFVVKSNVKEKVNFEVYLTKTNVEKEIEANYIKVYLTDSKTDVALDGYNRNKIPTYFDLRVAANDPGGKQIYTGTLENYSSKNFRLRMWLSDSYVISSEEKGFSVKVNLSVY